MKKFTSSVLKSFLVKVKTHYFDYFVIKLIFNLKKTVRKKQFVVYVLGYTESLN